MQIANVMLALGGNKGHTVFKRAVTAAEIAVLRHIHGEDSVFDIQPAGEVNRGHREERTRLIQTYGKSIEGRFKAPAVEELFPGAAARVFTHINELDLPEEFFKPASRMSADPQAIGVGAQALSVGAQDAGSVNEQSPANTQSQNNLAPATPTGQPVPPSGAPQQPQGTQQGTVTDPALSQAPMQQAQEAPEPADDIDDINDEHSAGNRQAQGNVLD